LCPKPMSTLRYYSYWALSAVVLITKADAVDTEQLELVKSQVAGVLQNTFLAEAPVCAVNSLAPQGEGGIASLRNHLFEQALQIRALRAQGPFRLAIDRSFTLSGHGTVITGTVF